jgi:hypothetical protein
MASAGSRRRLLDVGLDLAALVNEKVAAELAALNGQLDRLVDEALDQGLGRLIRERVDQELHLRVDDGRMIAPEAHSPMGDSPEPVATKRCSACGEVKSLDAFEARRAQCRPCRGRARAEWRRRRQAGPQGSEASSRVPFPGTTEPG